MLSGNFISAKKLEKMENQRRKLFKRFLKKYEDSVEFLSKYDKLCHKFNCCFQMTDYEDYGVAPASDKEVDEQLKKKWDDLNRTKNYYKEILKKQ